MGENAHFVEEFSRARQRVLRFLSERCGFTVFAFEFGFSEAFPLDRWLQGEGDDADLARVSKAAAEWGAADLMHWLRRHNRTSGHPLRFAGIDLPEAGGALRPALEPVADYLREIDPDALPILDTVLRISDRFLGSATSGAAAAPAWAALDTAEQDARELYGRIGALASGTRRARGPDRARRAQQPHPKDAADVRRHPRRSAHGPAPA
ncbi:erythromycin esterase family protein [Nonomuraea sp. NPDC000554]|uniref:erythromycin esterase family protein n=1 Tax=Nonomuraea sp. NPDC000554 TaxID=3154259 RepID=UPI00332737E0